MGVCVLARLPLRSKLILVVSVPLFVILAFAGFGIADRLGELEGQREYGRLRFPNAALGDLEQRLEDEGALTTWYVAARGDTGIGARLDRARDATDRAVASIDAARRAISTDDVTAASRRGWARLQDRLGELDVLRRQADELAGLPSAFGGRYVSLADDAVGVSALVARDIDDRALSERMAGIVELRRERAEAAREAMIVLPYLATGTSTQFSDWVASREAQDAARRAFVSSASPAEQAAFLRLRDHEPQDPFRAAAGEGPGAFPKVALSPEQYYAAWEQLQDTRSSAIAAVQRVVDTTAADLESGALRAVLGYGLGVSTLVLVVLVLAWVMIRSVNRSLHALTEAARDVAENQLPHLVDTLQRGGDPTVAETLPTLTVDSKDEIGALAQAFNTIQETTIRVAEEQAALLRKGIGDLYVNLARRNQSLVDRQIELLDALEARAEDPEQLASLFELDHLATRMRRNAESLLVLSGAGQARQWSEAIPVLDVVRAASGEIADFARVSFVGFETDVAVAGNAVADVTHILAELLENATSFSPPGTPVVVAGMLADRRFIVSITDEGIGMDDHRLAMANALLQQPPPPGLSLSRTLGLHVVAHLANRYGIRVQLRRAATNGVTAIVALPAAVLTRVVPSGPTRVAPPPSPATPPVVHPASPGDSRVAEPIDRVVGEPVESPAADPEVHADPVRAASTPGWAEPEVIPPAFDPDATVPPPAATPAAPLPGEAWVGTNGFTRAPGLENGESASGPGADLPRRVSGSSPGVGDGDHDALPRRSPGRHLSHRPAPGPAPAPAAEAAARPRPERVHDLLTRHLRGIRDGRGGERVAGVAADRSDAEDLP